jgi:hypothetical protein
VINGEQLLLCHQLPDIGETYKLLVAGEASTALGLKRLSLEAIVFRSSVAVLTLVAVLREDDSAPQQLENLPDLLLHKHLPVMLNQSGLSHVASSVIACNQQAAVSMKLAPLVSLLTCSFLIKLIWPGRFEQAGVLNGFRIEVGRQDDDVGLHTFNEPRPD